MWKIRIMPIQKGRMGRNPIHPYRNAGVTGRAASFKAPNEGVLQGTFLALSLMGQRGTRTSRSSAPQDSGDSRALVELQSGVEG